MPPPNDPTSHVVEIDIPSSVELVTVVRMIVAAAANVAGALAGDRLDDLRWVTSEAFTNAIEANLVRAEEDQVAPGRVHARCEITSDGIRLVVSDQGLGLPDADDLPHITHPDRLHIEGGFGVPLMQHLTRGQLEFTSTRTGTTLDLRVDE